MSAEIPEGNPPLSPRARLAPILTACLLFLCGLWIHLRLYPIGNLGVETDFYGDLAVAARKLSQGQFSVLDYPHKGPLYPLILAGLHAVISDWYRAGVVLNLLCACGSILLIWRLCLRLFSPPVAFWTMLFVASNYVFFVDAHKATTDHLFLVLCLGSMVALFHQARSWRSVFVSGVLGALAFLTRYNGAFLVVASVPALLLVSATDGPEKNGVRAVAPWWRAIALWGGAFLLLSLPWFALNMSQTGQFLYSQNIGNISREFYTDPRFPNRPPEEIHSLGQLIARHPGWFVGHYLANLPRHLWNDLRYVINPFGAVFVVLGTARLFFRRPTRRQTAFYCFALAYAAAMGLVFYLPRFRVLVAVAEYTLAFSLIWDTMRVWARPAFKLLLCLLLLIPQILLTVQTEMVNDHDRPLYMLDAASFLRDRQPQAEGTSMLALKPHLPFLAGMKYQGYPWEVRNYPDLLRHIRQTGVRYVCLGKLEAVHVPGVQPLFEADSLPGLHRIYRSPDLSIFEVPTAAEALLAKAQICAQQGRWKEAEAALLSGLRSYSDLASTVEGSQIVRALRGNLAVVYLQLGKHEEAIALLGKNLADLGEKGDVGANNDGAAENPPFRDQSTLSGDERLELAQTLSLLAAHEERLGRNHEARVHLEESLREYVDLRDEAGAGEIQHRLDALK